jgi:hypothetical protein
LGGLPAQLGDLGRIRQIGLGRQLLSRPGAPRRGGRGQQAAQLAQLTGVQRGQPFEHPSGGAGRQRHSDPVDQLPVRPGDHHPHAVGEQQVDGLGQALLVDVVEHDQGVAAHRRRDRTGVLGGTARGGRPIDSGRQRLGQPPNPGRGVPVHDGPPDLHPGRGRRAVRTRSGQPVNEDREIGRRSGIHH